MAKKETTVQDQALKAEMTGFMLGDPRRKRIETDEELESRGDGMAGQLIREAQTT